MNTQTLRIRHFKAPKGLDDTVLYFTANVFESGRYEIVAARATQGEYSAGLSVEASLELAREHKREIEAKLNHNPQVN